MSAISPDVLDGLGFPNEKLPLKNSRSARLKSSKQKPKGIVDRVLPSIKKLGSRSPTVTMTKSPSKSDIDMVLNLLHTYTGVTPKKVKSRLAIARRQSCDPVIS